MRLLRLVGGGAALPRAQSRQRVVVERQRARDHRQRFHVLRLVAHDLLRAPTRLIAQARRVANLGERRQVQHLACDDDLQLEVLRKGIAQVAQRLVQLAQDGSRVDVGVRLGPCDLVVGTHQPLHGGFLFSALCLGADGVERFARDRWQLLREDGREEQQKHGHGQG